jgi:hypothetical protein
MARRGDLQNIDGKGKTTLHPRACMAHYPQMPQKGVLAQVCQGSSILAELAFHGEKALSSGYPELHGYLIPEENVRQLHTTGFGHYWIFQRTKGLCLLTEKGLTNP